MQLPFLSLLYCKGLKRQNFLKLVGSQTWSWLLLLGQSGCHGNGCSIGNAGERRGPRCNFGRALPLSVRCTFRLEDIRGIFEESPTVREVLVPQDLIPAEKRETHNINTQTGRCFLEMHNSFLSFGFLMTKSVAVNPPWHSHGQTGAERPELQMSGRASAWPASSLATLEDGNNNNINKIKDDIISYFLTKPRSCYLEEWCGCHCSELSDGSPTPQSAAGTVAAALQTALPDSGNNLTRKHCCYYSYSE